MLLQRGGSFALGLGAGGLLVMAFLVVWAPDAPTGTDRPRSQRQGLSADPEGLTALASRAGETPTNPKETPTPQREGKPGATPELGPLPSPAELEVALAEALDTAVDHPLIPHDSVEVEELRCGARRCRIRLSARDRTAQRSVADLLPLKFHALTYGRTRMDDPGPEGRLHSVAVFAAAPEDLPTPEELDHVAL